MASISSRVTFLHILGGISPAAWDAIIPHGPRYSPALRELILATIVRDVAAQLGDKAGAEKLMAVGKDMVGFASKRLLAGWEEGDDICPPWWPFPFPRPWPPTPPWPPWAQQAEPDPIPWQEHAGPFDRATQQRVALSALRFVAEVSLTDGVADRLNGMLGDGSVRFQ